MTALLLDTPATERATGHEMSGPSNAPVILALGGISASRHVVRTHCDSSPGWWEGFAGPGCPLDTTTHRIVSFDYRDGGRGLDGRPANTITTRDQAAHIAGHLDELGVTRLGAVVGASYGGMVALALAAARPDLVGRLIVISAAHEPHPMATALRAIQRRIVERGLATGHEHDAMVLARALAMTTYRSAREFALRFEVGGAGDGTAGEFDVERYLISAGEKFALRMRPERFLALSLSVDLHRVTPEEIRVPTTVIAARGDTIAPPSQLRAMARRLPRLQAFHLLRTRFGHDAFLTEPRRLGALLSTALRD